MKKYSYLFYVLSSALLVTWIASVQCCHDIKTILDRADNSTNTTISDYVDNSSTNTTTISDNIDNSTNTATNYDNVDNSTSITSEGNFSTEFPEDSCKFLTPDDYVDDLISKLENKTIDTIPLPDDPGFTSLKEGQVWGLSTLQRVDNATVKCNETSVTVEVLLSFEELKGRYTWKKKVLLKELSGYVFVKADTAEILFRVSQNRGNNTAITLEEMSIKNLSGITTTITGLGIVGTAVNAITEPAANMFKKALIRMVEGPLKEAIALALRDIDVPLN